MRAYYFGNMYLSSIQQGIQAAHVTHELFNEYPDRSADDAEYLYDWSENHKTMILLNAGYADNIRNLIDIFRKKGNPFPWTEFYEGEDSLDGALTCVGIILPEDIYESAAYIRSLPFRKREEVLKEVLDSGLLERVDSDNDTILTSLTKWEFDFIQELNKYGMAS